MSVLEARNVTKTYREGKHEVPVLRGVSLAVERRGGGDRRPGRAREDVRSCASSGAC